MTDVTVKVLESYTIDKLLQVTALILMLNCIKYGFKSSPESCLKNIFIYMFCVDFQINKWNILPVTTFAYDHPSLRYECFPHTFRCLCLGLGLHH